MILCLSDTDFFTLILNLSNMQQSRLPLNPVSQQFSLLLLHHWTCFWKDLFSFTRFSASWSPWHWGWRDELAPLTSEMLYKTLSTADHSFWATSTQQACIQEFFSFLEGQRCLVWAVAGIHVWPLGSCKKRREVCGTRSHTPIQFEMSSWQQNAAEHYTKPLLQRGRTLSAEQ